MRWLIGVDLRKTSGGAVALARAVASRVPDARFFGAHVIEDHVLAAATEFGLAAAERVPTYVDSLLAPLREDDTFEEVGSIAASAAEDGLRIAAARHDCDTLVIGRLAPGSGGGLFRLGRVARRLVRELPRQIVVVPPDFNSEGWGTGPIVLAVDPMTDCARAATQARALASALDVDLLITHVVPSPDELIRYMPSEAWENRSQAREETSLDQLSGWAAARGLSDSRRSVVTGSVVPSLLRVSETAGASMLVIGSRKLGLAARMFSSSTGTGVAAYSKVPVMIAPP